MTDIPLVVYTDEYLQSSYQLLKLKDGVVLLGNRPPTVDEMEPLDITGRVIDITIRDSASPTFTAIVGTSSGVGVVISDATNGLFQYNLAQSNWADTTLLRRNGLVYSTRLITGGIPKRIWGGPFEVRAS